MSIINSPINHFGMEHFGKSPFGTNVSSQEYFGTHTNWRCGRSDRWTFQHRNVSTWGIFGMGNFRHKEFLAPEHFGTGIFRHLNISEQGYFGKAIWTVQHRHFGTCATVPKCPCAEISPCRNVSVPKNPHAEKSSWRKVLMPQSPYIEMFPCWNVHLPECLQYRMVHMPRSFRDETFVPKWLFLKFSVPKWSIGFNSACSRFTIEVALPPNKEWCWGWSFGLLRNFLFFLL